MNSPIRAVCFDLDGLMFNTEHLFFEAGGTVLRRYEREMTVEVMNVIIGRRPMESFTLLVNHLGIDVTPDELLEVSRIEHDLLIKTKLAPMPGLLELLDHIDRLGLPMGVATSSPRRYLEELLGQYDLRKRFHFTLTAEDVTRGKPEPEIYLKAAARFGVQPGEMMVFEDSAAGTKAAVTAGAYAVSVPHEYTSGHDFTGAKFVARTLADPRIYEALPKPATPERASKINPFAGPAGRLDQRVGGGGSSM